MRHILFVSVVVLLILLPLSGIAQERAILVPKPVPGAPFQYADEKDLFGQAYRWFLEGDQQQAVDLLKQLITAGGFKLNPRHYYVIVANFTDTVTPIGLLHGDENFFSRRMYGLKEDNLFYIYISRQRQGQSFLSVLASEKESPFFENLPAFLGIFLPLTEGVQSQAISAETTWIDVRRFEVPKPFRKFCDLSFIVKPDLSEDKVLAKAIFDNTSLERWSYGIATAITSEKDVDIIVNPDGKITVRPKPNLDLAAFAVINYHFVPVDTKAPTLASSFHLLGGLRVINFVEPIIGIGGGIPVSAINLHLFAGYSFEFANELKSNYNIGDEIDREVDPFKTEIRPKFRFGIEIKFP